MAAAVLFYIGQDPLELAGIRTHGKVLWSTVRRAFSVKDV